MDWAFCGVRGDFRSDQMQDILLWFCLGMEEHLSLLMFFPIW